MTAKYRLPVQHCPICDGPGMRLHGAHPSLALDAQCRSCAFYYTSTAHRAVLRALTDQRQEVR